jgi:hypothetical protein
MSLRIELMYAYFSSPDPFLSTNHLALETLRQCQTQLPNTCIGPCRNLHSSGGQGKGGEVQADPYNR